LARAAALAKNAIRASAADDAGVIGTATCRGGVERLRDCPQAIRGRREMAGRELVPGGGAGSSEADERLLS